jgi:hypothetical protein
VSLSDGKNHPFGFQPVKIAHEPFQVDHQAVLSFYPIGSEREAWIFLKPEGTKKQTG